jgi:hypothetical protein
MPSATFIRLKNEVGIMVEETIDATETAKCTICGDELIFDETWTEADRDAAFEADIEHDIELQLYAPTKENLRPIPICLDCLNMLEGRKKPTRTYMKNLKRLQKFLQQGGKL